MFTYFLEVINNKKTTGTTINLDNYIKLLLAKQELNSTINNLSLFSTAEPVQENHRECSIWYPGFQKYSHACRTMTCGWWSCTLADWFDKTIHSKLEKNDNTNIIIYTQTLAQTLLTGTTPESPLNKALTNVIGNTYRQYVLGGKVKANDACLGWNHNKPIGYWAGTQQTNLKSLKAYDDLISAALFEYMVSFVYT